MSAARLPRWGKTLRSLPAPLLALALMVPISVAHGAGRPEPLLVIAGATLIDGTGRAPQRNATLFIRGGVIERVESGRRPRIPARARVIRARGKFVIPGLVDAHTHIDSPGAVPMTEEQKAIVRDYTPRAFLFNGVTTVINMSAEEPDAVLALRERAKRQPAELLPRIYTGAAAFTAPNGWGSRYGGAVTSVEQISARIDDYARRGFDLVKILDEDGLGPPVFPRIGSSFPAAIARLATEKKLPVFIHATDEREYAEAVAADPRAIVHGLLTAGPPAGNLFTTIRKRGIIVVPTAVLFEAFSRFRDDPKLLDDPLLAASVPDFVLATARDPKAMAAAYARMDGVLRVDSAAWSRRAVADLRENSRRMAAAGVPLAIGSDAGGAVPHAFQGYSTPREIELLAKCCLTPMQTIVAATRTGAEMMGAAASFGTLEQGRSADLLILNGDPLADVGNIRNFDRMVLRGRVVERASLSFQAYKRERLPARR